MHGPDRSLFSEQDFSFLVDTLTSSQVDKSQMKRVVREDREIRDSMIADDRLFQRVMDDEEILLRISPSLFFAILLKRAKQDLEQTPYTFELQNKHLTPVFDSQEVVKLLADDDTFDYIVGMLASFVKIKSVTIPIRVRKGVWRKYRFSDFDVDSLIRYSETMDEDYRFGVYCRIADVCLFMAGMFPEYADASTSQHSRDGTTQLRGLKGTRRQDYESHGTNYYRSAAQHKTAEELKLSRVLQTLSDRFVLAEKPISLVSDRYLRVLKRFMFGG